MLFLTFNLFVGGQQNITEKSHYYALFHVRLKVKDILEDILSPSMITAENKLKRLIPLDEKNKNMKPPVD